MRARTADRADGGGRPHIFGEALFRGVLTRERKRVDRSEQPLALALVDVNDGVGADASIREAAIEAVAAATTATEVVGWLDRGAVIGVIVPAIPPSEVATARDALDARLRRALAKRLHADAVDRVSIAVHVYPEPKAEKGRWTVDPVFYPELRAGRKRRTIYDAVKRAMDVLGSLALLVILSPLLVLIAAVVELKSPGPVLFRQARIGQRMTPFTMLKFRTMHLDADHTVHHEFVSSFIKGNGQFHTPARNGFFKLTNDPRITPFGRILRKTSLDELPQLWNVLRGEMSLVGPRPPLPYEIEQYKPWHRRRVLEAKPGITGLWQVAGRSRTTFDEMVRLDLRYARTRSLGTDMRILLATPAAVISGKGAC